MDKIDTALIEWRQKAVWRDACFQFYWQAIDSNETIVAILEPILSGGIEMGTRILSNIDNQKEEYYLMCTMKGAKEHVEEIYTQHIQDKEK